MSSLARILELADLVVARRDPARLRWMWGDGLLVWSMAELSAYLGVVESSSFLDAAEPGSFRRVSAGGRYLDFASAYCAAWAARCPRVDQSDTCAPALATWSVYRRTGDPACLALTGRVIDYMRGEPRFVGEAVNHLGHSPEGLFYPRSVWVDSLMMFGVLAARYGSEAGDASLLDFAARQPRLYASLLQDSETGLFSHSWWARRGGTWPRKGLFWARGNAWVVASLPMILGQLPPDHPERGPILDILLKLSESLLALQRRDAWWDTILESGGGSYREASATALIAGGWMRASRELWLPERFGEAGLRAFDSLVLSLGPEGSPPSMRETSGPTIPLPLFPRLGYRLVPRGRDRGYGLAALFLAAIERERLG